MQIESREIFIVFTLLLANAQNKYAMQILTFMAWFCWMEN